MPSCFNFLKLNMFNNNSAYTPIIHTFLFTHGLDVWYRLTPLLPSLQSSLLRAIAGEGLCKLLLSRQMMSQQFLAKLLLLWYNPTMQDDPRLRSILGLFFTSFAALDRCICKACPGGMNLVFINLCPNSISTCLDTFIVLILRLGGNAAVT